MTSDEVSGVAAPIEKVERTVNVRGIATHMFEAGPPAAKPCAISCGSSTKA